MTDADIKADLHGDANVEAMARGIRKELEGYIDLIPGANWKEIDELIAAALREYGEAEYERGRADEFKNNVSHCEASTKQAAAAGFARGIEEAARIVIDYRSNGRYSTGHGFMTDLDDIAIRIWKL